MNGLSGKKMCVYCGAREGHIAVHRSHAEALGKAFAEQGVTLVYGGGSVGLMGVLSDAVLAAGGNVIGVIPTFLHDREAGHTGIQSLEVVDDMHQRKARMMALADAVVALPGGIGTLEELVESLTWRQLGLHNLPIGVLDSGGYYSDFFAVLESMVDSGFANLDVLHQLRRFETPQDMMEQWLTGGWH